MIREVWTNPKKRFLTVTGIVAALALLAHPLAPSPAHAALGGAVIWVGLLPSLLYHRFSDVSAVPLFPISGVFYAVCFGLPVFFSTYLWSKDSAWPGDRGVIFYKIQFPTPADAFSIDATLLSLIGVSMYVLGFLSTRRTLEERLPIFLRLPRDFSGRTIDLLAAVLIAIHFIDLFVPMVHAIPSVGQFAAPAGFLGFGIFACRMLRRDIRWQISFVVFGILFPLSILKALSIGLLTGMVIYFLFLFFVVWYARGRFPFIIVLIPTIVVILTYDLRWIHHIHIWQEPSEPHEFSESSFLVKTGVLADLTIYALSGETIFFDPKVIRTDRIDRYQEIHTKRHWELVHRLSLLAQMSQTIRKTPDEIPYWNGSSYSPLLTSVIPRMFWPGKPEERLGGAYGTRYGFVHENSGTSMNVPWIIELYMNFGALGVTIGMGLIGILFALVDRAFNSTRMNSLETVIGIALIFRFVYPESNFSLMWGGLPLLTLMFYLYFRIGIPVLERISAALVHR